MSRKYFIYILANWNNQVFYVGVTNNIQRRVFEHRTKQSLGFSSRYNLSKLAYIEEFDNISNALARAKTLKNLLRSKKIALIEAFNPQWLDLGKD